MTVGIRNRCSVPPSSVSELSAAIILVCPALVSGLGSDVAGGFSWMFKQIPLSVPGGGEVAAFA